MPMIYVSTDDVIEKLTTAEMAEALVKRNNWSEALLIAQGKSVSGPGAVYEDLRDVAEHMHLCRPVDDLLRKIIYEHVGRIV